MTAMLEKKDKAFAQSAVRLGLLTKEQLVEVAKEMRGEDIVSLAEALVRRKLITDDDRDRIWEDSGFEPPEGESGQDEDDEDEPGLSSMAPGVPKVAKETYFDGADGEEPVVADDVGTIEKTSFFENLEDDIPDSAPPPPKVDIERFEPAPRSDDLELDKLDKPEKVGMWDNLEDEEVAEAAYDPVERQEHWDTLEGVETETTEARKAKRTGFFSQVEEQREEQEAAAERKRNDPVGVLGDQIDERFQPVDYLDSDTYGKRYEGKGPNGEPVAIRFLPSDLSETHLFVYIQKELSPLVGVRHPNLETILCVTGHADRGVVVTEPVEGTPLAEQEPPLETERVLSLALNLAKGLRTLHAENALHRDVALENIRLQEDGSALLMRAGLARSDPERFPTRGHLETMSPEQLDGRDLGPGSDLYGLGAVLYELIEGENPFQAKRPSIVLHEHLEAPVSPPGDGDLGAIVARLLNKDPEARYPDANALISDLETLAEQGTVSVDEPGRRKREGIDFGSLPSPPVTRRRPTVWMGLFFIILLATVGGGVVFGGRIQGILSRAAAEPPSLVEALLKKHKASVALSENPSPVELRETLAAIRDHLLLYDGEAREFFEARRKEVREKLDLAVETAFRETVSLAEDNLRRGDYVGAIRIFDDIPEPLRTDSMLERIGQAEADLLKRIREEKGMAFVPGTGDEPDALPAFFIDVREVSNADYAAFVKETAAEPPATWGGRKTPPPGTEDEPVTGILPAGAVDYAEWAGKRLPTQAEWTRAALGPERDSGFPWGDTFEGSRAVFAGQRLSSVNSHTEGQSPVGCHHMAGNAFEIVRTPDQVFDYGLKGGSRRSLPPNLRADTPAIPAPDSKETPDLDLVGFRCVVGAKE